MSEVIKKKTTKSDGEIAVLLALRRDLLRAVARTEKRLKALGVVVRERGEGEEREGAVKEEAA